MSKDARIYAFYAFPLTVFALDVSRDIRYGDNHVAFMKVLGWRWRAVSPVLFSSTGMNGSLIYGGRHLQCQYSMLPALLCWPRLQWPTPQLIWMSKG